MLRFFQNFLISAPGGALGGALGWLLLHVACCWPFHSDWVMSCVEVTVFAAVGALLIGWKGAVRQLREDRRQRVEWAYTLSLEEWAAARRFQYSEQVSRDDLTCLVAVRPGDRWEVRHQLSGFVGGTELVMLDACVHRATPPRPGGGGSGEIFEEAPSPEYFRVAVLCGVAQDLPEFRLEPLPRWMGQAFRSLGLTEGMIFDEPLDGDAQIRAFRDAYQLVPLREDLPPQERIELDTALRQLFTRDVLHHFAGRPGWTLISGRGHLLLMFPGTGCPAGQRDAFVASAVRTAQPLASRAATAAAREVVPGPPLVDRRRMVLRALVLFLAFGAGSTVGIFVDIFLLRGGWSSLANGLSVSTLPFPVEVMSVLAVPFGCGATGVLLCRWLQLRAVEKARAE